MKVRRLILTIDALYEAKTRVVILAAAAPIQLLQISEAEKAQSLYDEVFAFDRTISRLLEMQSAEYIKSAMLSRKIGSMFLESLGVRLKSLDIHHTRTSGISEAEMADKFRRIWEEYNVNHDDDKRSKMSKADLVVLLHDLFYTYSTSASKNSEKMTFEAYVSTAFHNSQSSEWNRHEFETFLNKLDWCESSTTTA